MHKKITHEHGPDRGYITDHTLLEFHNAKNVVFAFLPSSDTWVLGLHKSECFDMRWLHDAVIKPADKLALLTLLADSANRLAPPTVRKNIAAVTACLDPLEGFAFQPRWPHLTVLYQRVLAGLFRRAETLGLGNFSTHLAFIDRVGVSVIQPKFLDPDKGALTDLENQSVDYAFRRINDELFRDFADRLRLLTAQEVTYLGTLVAANLNRAILRRPSQLVEMKWADVRPYGVGFEEDIGYPQLADDERLHLRVFLGKRGDFRGYAERHSHPLQPAISRLLALYHHHYWQTLLARLVGQGIELTKADLGELWPRAPMFPARSLFTTAFDHKSMLFTALSVRSQAFHRSDEVFGGRLKAFYRDKLGPHLTSDRRHLDPEQGQVLPVGNNRFRHTALTNGAMGGMSTNELASLTGVSEGAVAHYVDLTPTARAGIDMTLASNPTLNGFGRTSVTELQSQPGYAAKNEYDQVIGLLQAPQDCASCLSRGGKPLACYPCQNFKPFVDADHHAQLDKAERRLALQLQAGAGEGSLKPLRTIVSYIRATILACEQYRALPPEAKHDVA